MSHSALSAHAGLNLSSRTKLGIFVGIALAMFVVTLDQTTDLNGNALFAGAVTVYLLRSTDSDPIFGNLFDLPFDEIDKRLANGGAGDRRSTVLRCARDGGVRWF